MMTIVLFVLVSVLGCGNAERTSGILGCLNYQYMYNEACYSCPTQCKICVSETNCTVCYKGFYGPVCENNCDTNCTGTCHKQYGHCTYGCPDGTYPADDNSCKSCSDPCTICTSESDCVLCKDGPCQETCPENCVQCNISSGQCLLCNGSFSLQDGQCRHHNLKERTWNTTVISIVVSIIVIVIGIAIAVLVLHRFVTKKKEPNETKLSTLDNDPEKEGRSEQDDDDISDLDAHAIVLLSSEDVTSDLDENASVPLSSEGVIHGLNVENMSEAPGPVPEPEQDTRDIHKLQADRSSNRDTGIMPSVQEAQLKPYDTQQLLPTETFSNIATPPNMPYQDSQQRVIKHVPTKKKTKTHGPYTRPSRDTLLK